MKNERSVEIIREKIQQVVNQFGFKVINDEIDLRDSSNEDVLKFLYALKGSSSVLFHGSNSQERFHILESRQASDVAKESGNKKAVYADEGITVPLYSAILNRAYLESKFGGFTVGWENNDEGKMIFKFDPNSYRLFKSGDHEIFRDGYVYILNKANFINAEDAGSEWHAESDQEPLLCCRVSKKLSEILLSDDTVVEFSTEEMKQIESTKSK